MHGPRNRAIIAQVGEIVENERVTALKKLDGRIRSNTTRAVELLTDWQAEDRELTAEEKQLLLDAGLPEKDVPFRLKAILRIHESYMRAEREKEERAPLAIQINFGSLPDLDRYSEKRIVVDGFDANKGGGR